MNRKVLKKSEHFDLSSLLHMDTLYFKEKIWPHMFYMSHKDIWRWKMNTARAMGNTKDPQYIPELLKAFDNSADTRVQSMCAWAMGRIGGRQGRQALDRIQKDTPDRVVDELVYAQEICV